MSLVLFGPENGRINKACDTKDKDRGGSGTCCSNLYRPGTEFDLAATLRAK